MPYLVILPYFREIGNVDLRVQGRGRISEPHTVVVAAGFRSAEQFAFEDVEVRRIPVRLRPRVGGLQEHARR